jgi:hypothetical protein
MSRFDDDQDVATVESLTGQSTSPEQFLTKSRSLPMGCMTAWAVLPEVAMKVANARGDQMDTRSPWPGRLRNTARALSPRRGPSLLRVGPVLFVSTSIQTDRVLKPVLDELAPTYGTPRTYVLPRLSLTSGLDAHRAANKTLKEYRTWFDDEGIIEPAGLEEEIVKAEILLRRGRLADFGAQGVRAIIVGSQHNGPTRSILAAAHIAGGPATCYLPHAPVADNPFYRDLPVHHALLRGEAEVAFYRRLGVHADDAITVVGQPGLTLQDGGIVADANHVIYAASDHSEDVLRADIEVIRRGVDRPVEVCLHPRMAQADCQGLFPEAWTVHPPGPTMDVLRVRGAFALIQHGSGVGLEAMSAGVDIIDLCPRGERPNYPFISAPHVQVVPDSLSLRRALEAVPARRSAREARTKFARSWTSVFDPDATTAAAAAIRAIVDTRRSDRILLDGWPAR